MHSRHQQKVDFTHTILASRWTSYTTDTKTEGGLHTHNPCFSSRWTSYTTDTKTESGLHAHNPCFSSRWTSYTTDTKTEGGLHTHNLWLMVGLCDLSASPRVCRERSSCVQCSCLPWSFSGAWEHRVSRALPQKTGESNTKRLWLQKQGNQTVQVSHN